MGTPYNRTREVLVLTAVTRLDSGSRSRRAIEIQNLGPNAIYVALGDSSLAVVSKARKVNTGEAWALDLDQAVPVYAICSVSQLTLGATIVTEP